MRGAIPVNLASQPFRRDRPWVILGVAGGALLAALLVYQVSLAWIQRRETAEVRQALERASAQLRVIQTGQAQYDATLRLPANSAALEESLFFNMLLRRKGISWTLIFSDLESVVPHNVRLVAVRPQVSLDNRIVLEMTVACQSTEPVIDMLRRLESSELFGATAVRSWLPPSQSEPLYRYTVNANYAPRL